MEKKELKTVLKDRMIKYGFEYYKNAYYFDNNELVSVVALQKSNFDNSYYLVYGFLIKAYNYDLKFPKYYVCDINGRFIFNINGKSTDNFNLEVGNVQILEESIDKTYQTILHPVLENGLSEYYKILPECIVSATLRTKKYLGME